MPAFIQVAYSQSGDLVHFVNTLPLVDQTSQTIIAVNFVASPALVFNEVYANGGAYWQWVIGSGNTQSNAGYCYIVGWCSPKNFYWKATCYGCTSAKGRWNANPSTTVKASAFVPSTHATTLQACYRTFYNGGASSTEYCINQNIYYNTWVSITPIPPYNIKKIELPNIQDSSSLKEIGWDETNVYTP